MLMPKLHSMENNVQFDQNTDVIALSDDIRLVKATTDDIPRRDVIRNPIDNGCHRFKR